MREGNGADAHKKNENINAEKHKAAQSQKTLTPRPALPSPGSTK
jgi:hypothetical protein